MGIQRTEFKANIPVTPDEQRWAGAQDGFLTCCGKRNQMPLASRHSDLAWLLYTLNLHFHFECSALFKVIFDPKVPEDISALQQLERAQLKVIAK